MTDYTLSNTLTFFKNDPDVELLLDVVKQHNKLGSVEMQNRTLNLICLLSLSAELHTLLKRADQQCLWDELLSITDTWTEAWLEAVKENLLRINLCKNQTVLNYVKLVN